MVTVNLVIVGLVAALVFYKPALNYALKGRYANLISKIDYLLMHQLELNEIDVHELVFEYLVPPVLGSVLVKYPFLKGPVEMILVDLLKARFNPVVALEKAKENAH